MMCLRGECIVGLLNNRRNKVEYFFRLEYPLLSIISFLFVGAAVVVRWKWHRRITLNFSLAGEIAQQKKESHHFSQKFFYALRICVFGALAFLIGKPQLVDSRSNIIVEGIDIILTLDASGSMQFTDYSDDERSRFQVAKDEAIHFIQKRSNDAVGLVVFGKAALCRCPLTMDKNILTGIIEKMAIGDIDHEATMLSTALITAINRLKSSEAQSKVIILLTDGEPSPGDVDPEVAIKIAKKFGIKVYTVGIGSDSNEMMFHPAFGGIVQKPKVNGPLLKKIARETGGAFFMARNDKDMRSIYDTIDHLERTKHESPLYSRYVDIYSWYAIVILLLLLVEQFLASFVWFGL